jgi:hypothetical protein
MMNNIVGYWGSRCSSFSVGSDDRIFAERSTTGQPEN